MALVEGDEIFFRVQCGRTKDNLKSPFTSSDIIWDVNRINFRASEHCITSCKRTIILNRSGLDFCALWLISHASLSQAQKRICKTWHASIMCFNIAKVKWSESFSFCSAPWIVDKPMTWPLCQVHLRKFGSTRIFPLQGIAMLQMGTKSIFINRDGKWRCPSSTEATHYGAHLPHDCTMAARH